MNLYHHRVGFFTLPPALSQGHSNERTGVDASSDSSIPTAISFRGRKLAAERLFYKIDAFFRRVTTLEHQYALLLEHSNRGDVEGRISAVLTLESDDGAMVYYNQSPWRGGQRVAI